MFITMYYKLLVNIDRMVECYYTYFMCLNCIFLKIENEVDGETLRMLVNCASVEQMQLCGLKTIKDQMKLKKVFAVVCHGGNADSTFAVPSSCATPTFNSSDTSGTSKGTKKLTLSEIKNLTPEEKRLYYMK